MSCNFKLKHFIVFKSLLKLSFLLTPLLLIFSYQIFGQSANLDQIRNGTLGVYPTTPTADWVNGNAGPSNAHFAEGYSIPYRASVSGLVGNANTIHHLIIEWDTKHGNGHALDYITHYQNLDNPVGSHLATFGHGAETINPTLGTAFGGAPSLFPIPAPSSAGSEKAGQPTSSFNALPTAAFTNFADATKMAIWGGTIVSLTYVFEDAPDGTTAQTETRLDIAFKSANGSTALIAWGGHIAAEYDWGAGRGATGVSGSPYHTRIIEIDGKPGNQDRSLKATAVIIPPPVCGISDAQFACPETASLTFSATGSSTGLGISYAWTINAGNTAGAKINGSNTGFTVEIVPVGTDFIAGGTFNLTLVVTKAGASSTTTCSKTPAGTIVKTIVTATADPTTIDLTSAAHSTTLTANIDGTSTFPTNTDYTYAWSIVTLGTSGSLTNDNQRIATYTAAATDPASITFKVIATLNKTGAPACVAEDEVTVETTGTGTCTVSEQAAVCTGTETTHNGTPSPKPATATYTWSLEAFGGGGTTTSTLVGGNSGGVTQKVNAVESYRIKLTQVYENTAFNTSCFKDVTVIQPVEITANYVAPASCDDPYFKVEIPNSVDGATYLVTQGDPATYSQQQTGDGTKLTFTGLTPGGGFKVTATTETASCPSTYDCPAAEAARPGQPVTETKVSAPADNSLTNKLADIYKISLESPTKVNATPNPFTEKVRFDLVSGVSGYGTLELYNALGQKVGVVYQGYIQAGRPFVKEYSVNKASKGTLIYMFKVGDQKVTGKLINLR